MDPELKGEDYFSDDLNSSANPVKRGRRYSLDEDNLLRRRDSLVALIEADWGLFGWELKNAKSVSDVRKAIKQIDPGIQHYIQLFMWDTKATATRQELRKHREHLNELETNPQTALFERRCRERLDKANSALQQAVGTDKESEIRSVVERRKNEHTLAQAKYEGLLRTVRELQIEYQDAQAYIAQAELLRFVRSNRYSFTPLRLANSMAGLPEMGWRQSAQRCGRHKLKRGDTTVYWLFKLIRSAVDNGLRGSDLKSSIKLKLDGHSHNSDYRLQEVKKNWYHLRRAFDKVSQQIHHPGAVPYRIVAEYQRNLQYRTALDLFLEEEEQLF